MMPIRDAMNNKEEEEVESDKCILHPFPTVTSSVT